MSRVYYVTLADGSVVPTAINPNTPGATLPGTQIVSVSTTNPATTASPTLYSPATNFVAALAPTNVQSANTPANPVAAIQAAAAVATQSNLEAQIAATAKQTILDSGISPVVSTAAQNPNLIGSVESWIAANPALAAALGLTAVGATAAIAAHVLKGSSSSGKQRLTEKGVPYKVRLTKAGVPYEMPRRHRRSRMIRRTSHRSSHRRLKFGSPAYRRKYLGHR